MAELGPAEYFVLWTLRDGHPRRARLVNDRFELQNGPNLSRRAVSYLKTQQLVSTAGSGVGPAQRISWSWSIEITGAGQDELEEALDERWYFTNSGLSERRPTYWFETKDPVSGRGFMLSVWDKDGEKRAKELANAVATDRDARIAAREIEEPGHEHGIDWEVDGETVRIWRKEISS